MSISPRLRQIGELVAEGAILEIQDGNHGELHPKASEYVTDGVPFVMASDIHDGQLLLEQTKRLPKARTDGLRIGFARTGDVLLTHKGTVGEAALVPSLPDYVMLTPQVTYYRCDDSKLDRRYLLFAFRSPMFQAQLRNVSAQSTRPYIGITSQRRLSLPIPPLSIQRRIASILGTYDDLIEVNRRRIAVLEEMARRLFEEWFVHFRFPGYENGGTTSSELGDIPRGWRILRLGDVAQFASGNGRITKSAFVDRGYTAYSASGPDGLLPEYACSGSAIIVSAVGAYCGRTWFARDNWTAIANTFYLTAKTAVSTEYLFFATRGMSKWPRRGAAQPFIAREDAANTPIMVPASDLVFKFTEFADAALQAQANYTRTIQALENARDLLLPRLISGDLSVSVAETELETAA